MLHPTHMMRKLTHRIAPDCSLQVRLFCECEAIFLSISVEKFIVQVNSEQLYNPFVISPM